MCLQSTPFASKVDPKAQGCRNYYDVIKSPMWLDKVKQRLGNTVRREYTHPAQFRDDMRQIWSNCRMFNPEHSDVRCTSAASRCLIPQASCSLMWPNSAYVPSACMCSPFSGLTTGHHRLQQLQNAYAHNPCFSMQSCLQAFCAVSSPD